MWLLQINDFSSGYFQKATKLNKNRLRPNSFGKMLEMDPYVVWAYSGPPNRTLIFGPFRMSTNI